MPIFTRRAERPRADNYRKFLSAIREDFDRCCAYCLLPELLASGKGNFELDHFRPKSDPRFAALANDYDNIYYACHVCNHYKSNSWPQNELIHRGYTFVDFCVDHFSMHYREESSGEWTSVSPSGEYTLQRLNLNSEHLVEIRYTLRFLASSERIAYIDWNCPSRPQIESLLQRLGVSSQV